MSGNDTVMKISSAAFGMDSFGHSMLDVRRPVLLMQVSGMILSKREVCSISLRLWLLGLARRQSAKAIQETHASPPALKLPWWALAPLAFHPALWHFLPDQCACRGGRMVISSYITSLWKSWWQGIGEYTKPLVLHGCVATDMHRTLGIKWVFWYSTHVQESFGFM